jgi:hypothetical protein
MAPLKTALVGGALVAALLAPTTASAASSKGCDGGGFTLRLADGSSIAPGFKGSVAASRLPAGTRVQVVGKYVTFAVDPVTFGVYDYAFTGASNPLDQTGGRRIVLYAGKVPDHRGLTLTAGATLETDKENLEFDRTGVGLSMKITAKDCANGGIFQVEPERGDGTTTRFTHTLGPDAFYYDNPNFRAREGDLMPFKDGTQAVTARINIGSDLAPKLVARDSPQVATRVLQSCVNSIPAPRRPGGFQNVDHCGGVSVWDVASGGRMGGVTGEDAVEVAPPATTCTHQCGAQNQVREQAVVLGFPFPVPAANRLLPRFPGA